MKWRILIRNKSLNPQSVPVSIENRWIYSICGFNPHRPPVTITRDHHRGNTNAESWSARKQDSQQQLLQLLLFLNTLQSTQSSRYYHQYYYYYSASSPANYDRLFVHFKFFLISTDVRPLLYVPPTTLWSVFIIWIYWPVVLVSYCPGIHDRFCAGWTMDEPCKGKVTGTLCCK